MPSDTYTDLTPVVNHGLLLTAPADGYIYILGHSAASTIAALGIVSSENNITTYPSARTNTKLFVYDFRPSGGEMAAVLPVSKGDNVWQDTANFITDICRFVYAQTEQRIIKY